MALSLLSQLRLNPDNPRTISEEDFNRLVDKIKRNPDGLDANKIVHKDGVVIAGNQRFRALKKLQHEIEIKPEWFKDVTGWTDDQVREWLITSNISDGEWDWDILANEWDAAELEEWGLPLPDSLKPDDEVEEDEAPEVSDDPAVSKLGEVYQLGRHRVMCGDSTDRANVELLMDGEKADVAITDPPYGINIVQNNSVGGGKLAKVTKYSPIENDDGVEVAHKAIEIMKETTENQIVFGGNYFADKLEPKMCWVVWDKDNTGNFADCELAWTSYDKAAKLYKVTWNGMIREGESGQRVHPTQKPTKLFGYIIKDFDPQSVQDLFLGSGSTLIACEQTNRTCYGMEIDPKYVDVIRKRYAKFTNNNQLPDNWEELTPPIDKEKT